MCSSYNPSENKWELNTQHAIVYYSTALEESEEITHLSLISVPPHPIILLPPDPAVWKNTNDGNWPVLLK